MKFKFIHPLTHTKKMGVESLTAFLKKQYNNTNGYITSLDMTKIQRVAIDGNQEMNRIMKVNWKTLFESMEDPLSDITEDQEKFVRQEWIKDMIRFIMKWLEIKVTPIFIIDGKSQVAKTAQKEKRQKARDSALQRYEELKKKVQQEQTNKDLNQWSVSTQSISDEDLAKIVSYRQQERSLSPVWIQELKDVFDAIGVPWIQATDEGEKLCCMLYLEEVDAVYSNDTDCLLYGCHNTINSFKLEISGNSLTMPIYNLNDILEKLKLNHEEFLDFCIMLGTDFNENIPSIGPVKALELIQTHHSISNLPAFYKKIPLDRSVLNEDICKQIYKRVPSGSVINRRGKNDTLSVQWEYWNYTTELEKYVGKTGARWIEKDMKKVHSF